jgi:hypothetical protein
VPLPLASGDIGGELIAILSKGLYTNPLDCLAKRGTADDRILDESGIERLTQLRNLIEDLGQRKRALKDDTALVATVDDRTVRARALLNR